MHSRKVLHRDIKTLNVLLDEDLNVKLGDMGVAKVSIKWGITSFQDGQSLEVQVGVATVRHRLATAWKESSRFESCMSHVMPGSVLRRCC